jgi:DNA-binding NtrC family response regulator
MFISNLFTTEIYRVGFPTISVLYVDDEPVLLDTLKLFLERDPEFRIATALSARKALEKIRTESFDAIVSDYEMPEIDGIAFLKIVRERYPKMPFIIFTGKGREEIVIESLNSGADYYVKKGGDARSQFAELASKVRHAVELRESQKKVARLNRLYIVLSRINEAIVRIRNKEQLMT